VRSRVSVSSFQVSVLKFEPGLGLGAYGLDYATVEAEAIGVEAEAVDEIAVSISLVCTMCKETRAVTRGAGGEKTPCETFVSPGKTCWTKFKIIGHTVVQMFLAPLRKLIAPLGIPSWLRA